MIIQCPECSSRYRIKDLPPGHADARLKCPKCDCRFILSAPAVVGGAPRVKPCAAVLLVDDAHFFREMLSDLLQPLQLDLHLAPNAAEAMAKLQAGSWQLLMLDLNLPDKNGLELIGEIRAAEKLKDLRILAMSAVYRREDDVLAALRAGADAFLNKSFRPDELRDKVKELLGL